MAKAKRKQAKEIIGSNMRDALSKLKKEFGKEAIIYSQEKKNGRVHILAGSEEDFQAVLEQNIQNDPGIHRKAYSQKVIEKSHSGSDYLLEGQLIDEVRKDVADIKQLLADQLASLVWHEEKYKHPVKVSLLRKLQALNFSVSCAKNLIDGVPNELYLNQAIQHVLVNIYDRVKIDMNVFNEQAYKLFVGPSGVGKTQLLLNLLLTITKKNILKDFAVVCVNQKLTGLEESKVYHRVFNVPAYYCESPQSLQATLNQLKTVSAVFIDCSIAPTHDEFNAFKSILDEFDSLIDTHFVSSATVNTKQLDEYCASYTFSGPRTLSLAKLDEDGILGEPLSAALTYDMPLRFFNASETLSKAFFMANKEILIKALVEDVVQAKPSEDESIIWKFSETVYHGNTQQQKAS